MFRVMQSIGLALMLTASASAIGDAQLDPIEPRLAGADPEHGSKIFLQCSACHVSEKGASHTVGPNLWGIVGRPVGGMEGFDYSDSLKAIGGVWDFEKLSRYLFDPQALAPQGRMAFGGIKRAQERADLIAYLRTLSDEPVALPTPPESLDGPRYGGLPEGDGREATYFTCRACHAVDQFTDRQLARQEWDGLLDEMVAKNGMAAPEPWARQLMLDYLATHFGEQQEDDWEGLPPGPGREEVYYSCNVCHSLKLVTQQGMNRTRWDDTLAWMIEEQGMSEFKDEDTRALVLDYLAEHFGS